MMSTQPINPTTRPFTEQCQTLRHEIKRIAADVKILAGEAAINIHSSPLSDAAEMAANLMLAYRHLEDAAMRVGKSVQAYDGGISVYDAAGGERASARR